MAAKKPQKEVKDKKPMPTAAEVIDRITKQNLNTETPKRGKPSKYSTEIAQHICEQLSDGIPLREICRQEGMPAWRTVYDWMYKDEALGDKGVGLSAAIARARDIGYDAIAEECLYIADNVRLGQEETFDDEGSKVTIRDMLGHRKLQIETRLKLLAKWNPKKYGDRTTLAGDPEAPLQVSTEATDMLAAAIKNLELKRQSNG